MNNQAAQTMPEPVTASMCPSSDYAKGWNDCLAALSQTARVPREPTREHIEAFKRAEIKCVADYDDDMSPEYRGLEAVFAMLSAASGEKGVG